LPESSICPRENECPAPRIALPGGHFSIYEQREFDMNLQSFCRALLLAAFTLSAVAVSLGANREAKQPDNDENALSRILAQWQERRATVHSLSAKTAKLEHFYPRGSLSDDMRRMGSKIDEEIPQTDKWVKDGQLSWDIDFTTPRVRKEVKGTVPFIDDTKAIGTAQFRNAHHLYLYNEGKLRDFRFHERTPEERLSDVDASLTEEAAVQFMIEQEDFPLLWLAGGVNGVFLNNAPLNYLPNETAWSFRGRAKWKDVDCYVLTIPEQNTTETLREFWVAAEQPFPILACRVRDGDTIDWQL
jgi:hypothetical protein